MQRPHSKGAFQSVPCLQYASEIFSCRLATAFRALLMNGCRRRVAPACCRQGSRCAQQVYDPKLEQEQTAKISRLEQQLRRNQLRHRQLTSMAQMARSQASQLRTTLDMLLAPDDLELDGAGTRWVHPL